MNLHVLTAVTRPHNLPALAASLAEAGALPGWCLDWHLAWDMERAHVGGQALKNAMLDRITGGWCWILDDDTVANPELFGALADRLADNSNVQLVAVAQLHRNGWVRQVYPQMLRASHVDAGQVLIRRDAIGAQRIPLHYCGDGAWIEAIAGRLAPGAVAYIDAPLTRYNWLRPAREAL